MPVRRLSTIADVDDLVGALFDPDRREPLLVVTTRNNETEPLVDVQALAASVDVDVVVLPTGNLTRHLTAALPEMLGVFGGASRIWWPGLTPSDPPHRHPLVFAYSAEEGVRAAARLRRELERWVDPRYLPTPATPTARRPAVDLAVDDEVSARVLSALPGGGEVDLGGGTVVWLVRRKREPELREGATVRVRVTGFDQELPVLRRVLPSEPAAPAAVPAPAAGVPKPGPRPTPPVQPEPATAAVADVHALQDELEDLRAEAKGLLARAEAAESEAWEVGRQLRLEQQERKKERRSLQDKIKHLEARLLGGADEDDPEAAFRAQVQRAWEQSTVGADRDQWPLSDYALGPSFLQSVEQFPDLRQKIAEVAAEVASGRVRTIPAREHHSLRTGAGGEDPQRIRWQDGAAAYRVAVQVKTPSARRLHYWRLPDGSAELACVVLHDDMTIT